MNKKTAITILVVMVIIGGSVWGALYLSYLKPVANVEPIQVVEDAPKEDEIDKDVETKTVDELFSAIERAKKAKSERGEVPQKDVDSLVEAIEKLEEAKNEGGSGDSKSVEELKSAIEDVKN